MKWVELKRSKVRVYGKAGRVLPKGMAEEHTAFLHNLLTNDIKGMKENTLTYNLWLKQNGFPLGEFFVYKLEGEYLLDTPLETEFVLQEFNRLRLSMRVYFEPLQVRHLFLFGEGAGHFVRSLFGVELEEGEVKRSGPNLIARNSLRLGEEGYDLIGEGISLPEEDRLTEQEYEDIRVERMVPKLGKELREGFSPLEACLLERAISLNKGCYVGQEAIARVHYRGRLPRVLALFEGRDLAEGERLRAEDKDIGLITSVSALRPLALGYILRAKAEEGAEFTTDRHNRARLLRLC
ncbi:MAG: folate-binding protein [Aquificaceae bacterium]|nr:folate-binding protein [Aquificaceae bacterium]MCX8059947.1 folate-binding protein [Aquificaceae bacterium]MDW8097274.1 folate-binding protein [Aquificaceae bacterium]